MLRCRLFAPLEDGTGFTIAVYTTTDVAGAAISVVLSEGSGAITQPIQALTTSVGTAPLLVGKILVTGCTAFTNITYTVSQSGETDVTGSPKTLPGDTTTPFSIIPTACDFLGTQWSGNSWSEIRGLIAGGKDILALIMPDDYTYVDTRQVSISPYISGGDPDTTEDPDDFHLAYGAWAGMFDAWYVGHNVDRQWIYNNVFVIATGGDHYVTNDYRRTTAAPVNTDLYTAAKAAWNTWIGDFQAPMALTSGELWLGITIGPVNFVFSEFENTCVPYDGADKTEVCYGSTQLTAINAFWNATPSTFNFLCSERFIDKGGQGWNEFHTTEAGAWKVTVDANDNLNGVDGHLSIITGDRHLQAVIQHDSFAEFAPGQIHGQQVVGENIRSITNWSWGGTIKQARTNRGFTGDRPGEGFMVLDVTPGNLTMNTYQSYKGFLEKQFNTFTLSASQSDNVWSETEKMPKYAGILPDTNQLNYNAVNITNGRSETMPISQGLTAVIPAGYQITEIGVWCIGSGAEVTAAVQCYNETDAVAEGTPDTQTSPVIQEDFTYNVTSNVITEQKRAVAIPVPAGRYTVVIASEGATWRCMNLSNADSAYVGADISRDTVGPFPATWTEDATPTGARFAWIKFESVGGLALTSDLTKDLTSDLTGDLTG